MTDEQLTNQLFNETFGALPPKKDIRDYKAAATAAAVNIEIPEEFELEMPRVKNQAEVGSCVAHAISTVIEYFNKQQEGTDEVFSTGYIYGNRRISTNQNMGMFVDDAIHTVVKWGDVPNEKFPYNIEVPEAITKFEQSAFELAPEAYPHRFSSYFKLETAEAMKLNLLQNGPIVFSIPWYSDYKVEPQTGLLYHYNDTFSSYHAMVIYGWNKLGWKIQNSWSYYFGIKGRAVLPYDTKLSTCYGIIDEITSQNNSKQIEELKQKLAEKEQEANEYRMTMEKLSSKIIVYEQQRVELSETIEKTTKELEELEQNYAQVCEQSGKDSIQAQTVAKAIAAKKVLISAAEHKFLEVLKAVTDAYSEQLKLQEELLSAQHTIKEQSAQISKLETQLLEIEKPFKRMPTWLANIINAIINIFSKSN